MDFYETYHADRCTPFHLRLFDRSVRDLRALVLSCDVITVGGGNTANMLDVWRRQGVDELLREAWEDGAVVTGGLCWFHRGTTDSRRPVFRQALLDGTLSAGYGVDNLVGAVSSQADGRALRIEAVDGEIVETPLPVRHLG